MARYAYDAWGLRLGWVAANGSGERRGYTGHETLEGMGLVNMNGRLYDPALARFVSADPFVPNPDDWQSYNRYSYVLNNPLGYTDPSGYFHLGRFLRTVAAIAATVWAPQLSEFVWGGTTSVVVQGATAGFVAGGIQGGTLKSALIGAAGGAAFGGIHGMEGLHIAERAALHGIVGGAMSAAEGGDFGSGFLSTAFTTYASDAAGLSPKGGANKVTATVVRAIIGGVAARIAGGKFANGAMSAAMASALNEFGTLEERGYASSDAGPPKTVLFGPPQGDGVYDRNVYLLDENGRVIDAARGSTTPDMRQPNCKNGCPTIADGDHAFRAEFRPKFKGTVLVLGQQGTVPTADINPNNPHGLAQASGVYVHSGYRTGTYAEGCLTIAPGSWTKFIGNFPRGTTGTTRVIGGN